MTYSYSTPLTYGNQEPLTYNSPQYNVRNSNVIRSDVKVSSAAPAAAAGILVGLGAGAAAGSMINPYMKNGIPTDSFTKKTYKNYIKKAPDEIKRSYEQSVRILKNIDRVSSSEGLKKLFTENPEGAKEFCSALNQTPEEFLRDVNDSNLSENKKVIKDRLESGNKTRLQDMKNKITSYWDSKKKKFECPTDGNQNVFKAIKRSKRTVRLIQIGKFGGIGALCGGILAVLLQKIVTHKKSGHE